MDKELLKKVLSIPTYTRYEDDVREFLINWATQQGLEYKVDEFGNVFIRKGVSETYPCVVAHMDSVHHDQMGLVGSGAKLEIREANGTMGDILYAQQIAPEGVPVPTGIGGDDKAGIFIALELFNKFDIIMGAFFVEEEIGCFGSKKAVGEEWLDMASYFIQFDAPTNDWISKRCSRITLFNDEFEKRLEPIWNDFNLSKPSISDPYTDVQELRKNYTVNCINYFAGYEDMHTSYEFVVLDSVQKAINVGEATIKELGIEKHLF